MWWTVHIEGGPRRVNHAAVSIGERVFSFGGYCIGDNYQEQRPIDVFVLNTVNFRWTEVPKPDGDDGNPWPFQRYGHTVIAWGDQIYLFGGRRDDISCNVLFKFDTNTYTWSQPRVYGEQPGERDGHSACVINNAMYIFGGYEEVIERFGQDVYRLDLSSYTWKLLSCTGEPPVHRDFHSATAIGQNMFIFGGRSDQNGDGTGRDFYSNKICYLDTVSLRWFSPSILPPWPAGRRSHSAINLDGKLVIFGGYNGQRKEHKNDLWVLDTETFRWNEIQAYGAGPNPRRRQALCRVGSKIFLFGGTSPYTGPPLYFTPEQLSFLPNPANQGENSSTKLMDHNDLFVLDLAPSLKTLCLIQVEKHKLNIEGLPATILRELYYMSESNAISKPLRTVESLKTG